MKARRKDHDLSAAGRRLLECLGQPGAYAWKTDRSGASRLSISGDRKGVSVQIGVAAEHTARELESQDLARWDRNAHRPRFYLTEAGRSKLARVSAEGVDPFLAQHGAIQPRTIEHEGERQQVRVNASESPLTWLATRRGRDGKALVDAVALEAGERLRRDLTYAQVMPRMTANWSVTAAASDPAYAGLHYSDIVIAARQRVDRAFEAVGPEFAGLLIDVCGFLKGMETVESERGWPTRSAKVVLCLALARLARHYGYQTQAVGRGISRPSHWGAADYRPEIGPPQPEIPT